MPIKNQGGAHDGSFAIEEDGMKRLSIFIVLMLFVVAVPWLMA